MRASTSFRMAAIRRKARRLLWIGERRAMRRRRDRYLLRRKDLMNALIEYGLMPTNRCARHSLERLDPYQLRATALDEPLP